eukprot:328374-Pyramimonas_sp.AAC.1
MHQTDCRRLLGGFRIASVWPQAPSSPAFTQPRRPMTAPDCRTSPSDCPDNPDDPRRPPKKHPRGASTKLRKHGEPPRSPSDAPTKTLE